MLHIILNSRISQTVIFPLLVAYIHDIVNFIFSIKLNPTVLNEKGLLIYPCYMHTTIIKRFTWKTDYIFVKRVTSDGL